MNSRQKRVGMPNKEKIFAFWQEHEHLLGCVKGGIDWGIEEGECFACGNVLKALHRAHVIPLHLSGTNEIDNLHLLCPGCHSDSESIGNYWGWLHYKRFNEWQFPMEHLIRFITMQGIDLEKDAIELNKMNANLEQIDDYIKKIFNKIYGKQLIQVSPLLVAER